MATVTIIGDASCTDISCDRSSYAQVNVNTYIGGYAVEAPVSSGTSEVPLGSIFELYAFQDKSSEPGYIAINGVTVASGSKELHYTYTVNGDVTIYIDVEKGSLNGTSGYRHYGTIDLIEN